MEFRGRTSEEEARGPGSPRPDALPVGDEDREAWLRDVAVEATVYGLPTVLQHDLMLRQCTGPQAQAMSAFVHERELARPSFSAFRVPNVDTLYSSAWLDLTRGPVDVDLPAFGDRYFTLQFLDAFSGTTNLSRRTLGDARRVRVLPPGADAAVPEGTLGFRVDAPVMWVLMRIQVGPDDLDEVRALQDEVVLTPAPGPPLALAPVDGDVETDWRGFLGALDAALRLQGVPGPDAALVARFRPLGVLGPAPFAATDFDPVAVRGIARGFADAMRLLAVSRPLLGTPTASGWTRVSDKGRHGHNHLSRAIMNLVGLGANVVDENTSFNTYVDEAGARLDGRSTYALVVDEPPANDAFWSITLYDAESGMLYDAPDGLYSVGSAAGGRDVPASGLVTIGPAPDGEGTWLPSPPGPFFLTLRIYSPGPQVVSGAWEPPPVRRRRSPAGD